MEVYRAQGSVTEIYEALLLLLNRANEPLRKLPPLSLDLIMYAFNEGLKTYFNQIM